MKKSILLFLFLNFGLQTFSQIAEIISLTTTSLNDGVNVNLKTGTGHGGGYLSHSHTITGNTINLSVCFWSDATLPILYFENDFFIPLPSQNSNYEVVVTIFDSSSQTECEYIPTGLTRSTTFLETDKFTYDKKSESHIFPNPNPGIFTIDMGFLDKNQNTINIFDAMGRGVYNTHTKSSTFDISLPNLTSGLYFVKLQGDNCNETVKFIKE
jgi:hypothetical protein